jgi:hypothetical protein
LVKATLDLLLVHLEVPEERGADHQEMVWVGVAGLE